MSLWTRVENVFRADRLRNEIEEELESHVAQAIAHGRSEAEARKALGATLRQREISYALRVEGWLDALRADVVFGWRQLKRNRVSSTAAVLSLALAMGACLGAFRLIDAMLWRPLPIAHPEQLYGLSSQGIGYDGKWGTSDAWSYPEFIEMRNAVKGDADLVAVSYGDRADVTYTSDQEIEKATVVHVSGNLFDVFGLQPAAGRLLTQADDEVAGKSPYAVLSDDYWMRRFRRDPGVIGKTLHFQNGIYQIVGVSPKGFTGTMPATVADIFLPTAMHRAFSKPNMSFLRTLVSLHNGVTQDPIRDRLATAIHHFEERTLGHVANFPAQVLTNLLNHKLLLEPASTGLSGFRDEYRKALIALGVLVVMVLLIACVNVANLMTSQAAGRAKEMSLRVSIGAGRWRLLQLVLVETAMMAVFAAAGGALLAWWSAPLVVHMIDDRPDVPVQLMLPVDGHIIGFGIVLTCAVMLFFGLAPALRASRVQPASVLKGDAPGLRSRWMHAMIGAQVAFCFVVLFIAGLFVSTFRQLSALPLGFDSSRLLLLETTGRTGSTELTAWNNVMEHLRTVPGVQSVALSSWPLLSGSALSDSISVDGGPLSTQVAYLLNVSPAWLKTMHIPLIEGRDFREGDFDPDVAIVNEMFVKTYFAGADPLGKTFENGIKNKIRVIGVAQDAVYGSARDPMVPIAYLPPFSRPKAANADQPAGPEPNLTIAVKTISEDPMTMANTMRKEVTIARADMRVVNVHTQEELRLAQMTRERLLAVLSIFFGGVALLLAAIGLYGVLHYIVLEKRKDIGIRLALGARTVHVVREISSGVGAAVIIGTLVGIAAGIGAVRYIASLLYGVKPDNPFTLAIPLTAVGLAVALAALPAIRKALRVDPVQMLRAE